MEPIVRGTNALDAVHNDLSNAILPLNQKLPPDFIAKEVVPSTDRHRIAIFKKDRLIAIIELTYSGLIACITIHLYNELPQYMSQAFIDVCSSDQVFPEHSINKLEIELIYYREARHIIAL